MTEQRERGERIEVLVVTAVKEEWDAVLAVDTGAKPGSAWQPCAGEFGPELFARDFTSGAGFLRIGVVQAFAMGRDHAVSTAAPLLERHRGIRCLAMCGVCAGRRGDVALGDVIIADRAWPYDAGKRVTTADGARLQGDMDLYRIHPPEWKHCAERFQLDSAATWIVRRPRSYEEQGNWLMRRLATNEDPRHHRDRESMCPDWGPVLEQLWKVQLLEDGALALTDRGRGRIQRRMILDLDERREAAPFKTVVGVIASGSPVVEDPTIFDRLSDTQAMRKVVGLEMETSAILALAYLRKVPYAVVMKGVMDHADGFKSDNMKAFAAKASAECLISFLRQNLPVEAVQQDRGRSAQDLPISSGEIESIVASMNAPYHVMARAEYDRVAISSRAARLVGQPEPSERFIVIAQHGARDRSLASVVKFVGPEGEHTSIAPAGETQSFPPRVLLTNPAKLERHEDGVTWSVPSARIAIATDGSVALRIRLADDRQGKGGARRRGEVGLFTTLEQLLGAILYARKFGVQTGAASDHCFRLEMLPSAARLMCEPPPFMVEKQRLVAGAELVEPWPQLTEQVSLPIRIAGTVRRDADGDQLGELLNDVAHVVAVFFGVEDQVAALRPGSLTMPVFRDWV